MRELDKHDQNLFTIVFILTMLSQLIKHRNCAEIIPLAISGLVILILMGSVCYLQASALQPGVCASFQAVICFWHRAVGSSCD